MVDNQSFIALPMDLKLARELLEKNASQGMMLTYREYAQKLGINQAPVIGTCAAILEALMQQDAEKNQPLLAALVVQKGVAGIPRQGFYQKLGELGLYHGNAVGPQAVQWHYAEIEKLKNYYNKVHYEK